MLRASKHGYSVMRCFFLCMKDRKYDKRHVWSKNHSGCLETLCHVRGPLRNKMATLGVCSDINPSADPVPDQTMLPTVILTETDIPKAFLKPSIYVRLGQAYCWQHSLTRNSRASRPIPAMAVPNLRTTPTAPNRTSNEFNY